MAISPVAEARSENLPSVFAVVSPLSPRSRIKPRTVPSSFAQTIKTLAMGAWVIQVLLPDKTKPPSVFLARLAIAPGSEPEPGSVRPKAPMDSPRASLGRYLSRCAALPKASMGCITRLDWTESDERKAESTFSSSPRDQAVTHMGDAAEGLLGAAQQAQRAHFRQEGGIKALIAVQFFYKRDQA